MTQLKSKKEHSFNCNKTIKIYDLLFSYAKKNNY